MVDPKRNLKAKTVLWGKQELVFHREVLKALLLTRVEKKNTDIPVMIFFVLCQVQSILIFVKSLQLRQFLLSNCVVTQSEFDQFTFTRHIRETSCICGGSRRPSPVQSKFCFNTSHLTLGRKWVVLLLYSDEGSSGTWEIITETTSFLTHPKH